jgi:uncharacterized membrane protein YgcG
VAGGETLSIRERNDIERAARRAGELGGVTFSVLFATADGDCRAYAERAHATLDDPANSVLIFVDPARRQIEVVTGSGAGRRIDDRAAKLAVLAMTTGFSIGDLAGGVVDGLQMLGQYAHRPPVLHTDTP